MQKTELLRVIRAKRGHYKINSITGTQKSLKPDGFVYVYHIQDITFY